MLDPACGSGTFLYLAVREKRERLRDSTATLQHILDSVYGVDIHPLAVIVAKTNYILALGDLLKKGRGRITIPIYLADAVKLPERWARTENADYEVTIDGRQVYLPEEFLHDLALGDQAIELSKEFALFNRGKSASFELFSNYLKAQRFHGAENARLAQALFAIAEALKYFIESDRDTIWAFVLKSAYKPLFLKSKFDFVVGNPPWIAFRYLHPTYQKHLRQRITDEYKLLTGRGELITHLEVATLFLVHASDYYLKSSGTIAFVLPKSLFSADQHDGLRRRSFRFSLSTKETLFWREVWDCESVTPLFNVPSCVLIADKAGNAEMKYPIAGKILSGVLQRKNASLDEAEKTLAAKISEFFLNQSGKRSFWALQKGTPTKGESFYKSRFAQGATIVPRSFWFVQMKPTSVGFHADIPLVETADRAVSEAKDAYKSVFSTIQSKPNSGMPRSCRRICSRLGASTTAC